MCATKLLYWIRAASYSLLMKKYHSLNLTTLGSQHIRVLLLTAWECMYLCTVRNLYQKGEAPVGGVGRYIQKLEVLMQIEGG